MDMYCYDLDQQRKNQYKKWIAIFIGLFVLFLACFFLIGDVTATPVIQIEDVGTTYIVWNFSEPVYYTAIDGYQVTTLDNGTTQFTISDIQPDSKHTIKVKNLAGESSTNTTKSLSLPATSSDKIADFIFEYILLIFAVACFLIGFRIPIVGLIGTVFSIMGIVSALPKGNFYLDLIFGIGIFAGATITYLGVEK
jgi:hypothetical protein